MIDLPVSIQTVLTLVGLPIAFFFAYRIGKNKYIQDTIKGYESAINERDTRLKDADEAMVRVKEAHIKEIKELKDNYDGKIRTMQDQIATLSGKATVLEGVVTGKEYFEQLKTLLIEHDKEVEEALKFFKEETKIISAKVDKLVKQ